MSIAQILEPTGRQCQRLVPGCRPEDAGPVGGVAVERGEHFRVFRNVGPADQRHGQALRTVCVIEAETALDAQPVVIGRPIAAINANDPVVPDLVGQQTAHAAKGADRIDLAIDSLIADQGLGHQCTGRASLHAFAAGHAGALAHRVGQIEHDLAVRAAQGIPDHVIDLLFAAGAYTARALDAGIEVDRHGRMRQVGCRLLAAQRLELGAHGDFHLMRPPAEFAMLQRRVLLIPLVAGLGHVGQQHLQDHPATAHRALAVDLDLHAGGDRAAAARCKRALTLDLDHAGSAIAIGPITVLVAEVGDIDTTARSGLQDGLALEGLNGALVEHEGDGRRRRRIPGARAGRAAHRCAPRSAPGSALRCEPGGGHGGAIGHGLLARVPPARSPPTSSGK